MSRYIHFSNAEKETACQTDIAELLKRNGERLYRNGKESYWLDGTSKVSIKGNLWYHQYEGVGGNAVDFVRRFYNKSYPEAITYLLGGYGGSPIQSAPVIKKEQKPFEMPKKNDNMRRVYAYLMNRRGIDRDVIYTFAHCGLIYESEKYHNVVFVGKDNQGIPRHIHKRGTAPESTYKGNADSSIPEFSFHWNGKSDKIYLFEAPIDMLSFITMHKENWQQHSYAACCGVSDKVLFQMLNDNPNLKTVYLCLDNDEGGEKANKRISDKLFIHGIDHEILVPNLKDWNEDLLNPTESEEDECPALQL
mgnify:FL=1